MLARILKSRAITVVGLATIVLQPIGCGSSLVGPVRLSSMTTEASLVPAFTTSVYASADANEADMYLTDLPPEAFAPDADLATAAGQILHVRMFMAPRAGRTPIASSATTATVRHVVISRGAVGVYAGGGFFVPSSRPGEVVLGGELRDASLRVTRSTPNFRDVLGPTRITGQVRAQRDEDAARAIERRLAEIMLLPDLR